MKRTRILSVARVLAAVAQQTVLAAAGITTIAAVDSIPLVVLVLAPAPELELALLAAVASIHVVAQGMRPVIVSEEQNLI